MRIVMFYHSLVSCWNHGNAHFLRGVVRELLSRGHDVTVFEPRDGWSRENLVADHGPSALHSVRERYPELTSQPYDGSLDLGRALDGADVVIVHEWNAPELVSEIGVRRALGRFCLFFHDTHHRAVTAPESMQRYRLDHYDAVLAFGEVVRRIYVDRGWCARAFTWHEAADTSVFRPLDPEAVECASLPSGDATWVGNWGDGERCEELRRYLLEPVAHLRLDTNLWGVRYPELARTLLHRAGARHHGWLPNHRVPEVFARHRVTMHVPRRPYVESLVGIPTIRPFEALACGIPLVSSPWQDVEGLFRPGEDFLMARTPCEMTDLVRAVTTDPTLASALRSNGLATIRSRHTCAHRVDELLAIAEGLGVNVAPSAPRARPSESNPLPLHSILP